jgi:hypothetical protein
MSWDKIIGMKFERLLVISLSYRPVSKNGKKYFICKCDCDPDKLVEVSYSNLVSGHTRSCGCLRRETNGQSVRKYNAYDLSGDYGIGYFVDNKGKFYFDLDDYNKISPYYWRLHEDGYVYHQECIGSKRKIYMHRFIMDVIELDCLIDHEDRNKLNNKRKNLRIATHQENMCNQKISTRNTSGVTGVSFCPEINKWQARLKNKGIYYNFGYYENIKDAIIARLKAEFEYFGKFAPQKHLFEIYNIGEK